MSDDDTELLSWLLYSADTIDLATFAQENTHVDGDEDVKSDLDSDSRHDDNDIDQSHLSDSYEHTQYSDSNSNVIHQNNLTNRKKRQRDDVLERRLDELKVENAELQAHYRNVTQRTIETQRQRVEMEKQMITKFNEIREGKIDGSLDTLIQNYRDIYADYGAYRQKEVHYHLKELEKLIIPTQTTKMSLFTLQQDNTFYQIKQSPLFSILSQELNMSEEQWAKIQTRKQIIRGLIQNLKESLNLIIELNEAIVSKHTAFDQECGRIEEACSPEQKIGFLVWIKHNEEKLAKAFPEFARTLNAEKELLQVNKTD